MLSRNEKYDINNEDKCLIMVELPLFHEAGPNKCSLSLFALCLGTFIRKHKVAQFSTLVWFPASIIVYKGAGNPD